MYPILFSQNVFTFVAFFKNWNLRFYILVNVSYGRIYGILGILQIIKLLNNEMKIIINRICDVVLLLIVTSVVTSCRPRGLLSPNEMEDLFVELHRAEGIIYVKGYKNGHDSVVRLTYDSILMSHGVTRAQFDSSLVWYTDNPMVFDKIYPHVIDRLTALQEQERKRNEEEIHREQEEMHNAVPAPDANRLLHNEH